MNVNDHNILCVRQCENTLRDIMKNITSILEVMSEYPAPYKDKNAEQTSFFIEALTKSAIKCDVVSSMLERTLRHARIPMVLPDETKPKA